MKKTLGQSCYEASVKVFGGVHLEWSELIPDIQLGYEKLAKSVERAVLRRLKEGKKK